MSTKRRAHVCCTATECPTTRMLLREKGELLQILREDALCDHLGNYWCQQCYRRRDLINWAYEHRWPEVHCPPYMIAGGDRDLWKAAIYLSREECILSLYDSIIGQVDDEEKGVAG